jgi:hypothetical protein
MAITREALHPQPETQTMRGALKILLNVKNSAAHERLLNLYMVVVLLQWVEHIVQAYQIFVLNWPRPEAGGVLGFFAPWLLRTELLHWGYAIFMLVGLIVLLPGFSGRSRIWWIVSLVIQSWHFVEHSLLQGQAILDTTWFGSSVPASFVQIWVPRVELHLFYNAAVFIPMVIAMYFHLYPPKNEAPVACNCSRRSTGQATPA